MNLGILGSTRGSNLIPLSLALQKRQFPFEITVVISNRKDAEILSRAKTQGWPSFVLPSQGKTREEYDRQLSQELQERGVDCIVLIGYMRILSAAFVQHWKGRIINVHPSLLPHFSGLMDRAVHQAVLTAKHPETGCTVHEVNETLDGGPILVQKKCPVLPEDTIDSLKTRVQSLEVDALAEAIITIHQRTYHE